MPGRPVGNGGSSDHVALGRAVRELRARLGVTQRMLAFDAGLGDRYVGQVERGVVNPSFGVLLRMVRTLGYDLPELATLYARNVAEIDPRAGHGVPLCPTPESFVDKERFNAAMWAEITARRERRERRQRRG
jgi:transcriptional regulator with XRE-family HTH domain